MSGMVLRCEDDRLDVVVILGTRPEAIKCLPLIVQLRQNPRFHVVVINTGQHRDMVQPVLNIAGIRPDFDLGIGASLQSLNSLVSGVIAGVSDVIEGLRAKDSSGDHPNSMVAFVHGDTSTAMAGAVAAVQSRIPVMHVEAGMRTGDTRSPFPEELNRQIIARLACLHFSPTVHSMEQLVRERISADRIFVTGNTGIDALVWAANRPAGGEDEQIEAFLEQRAGPLIVATAHRRESWGQGIGEIALGLRLILDQRPEATLVIPLHPNPLVRRQITPVLENLPNVLLTDALGYCQFARLLRRATLVVTDSGGIQEEAPSLGTPVLVTRESTERVEGVEAGTLELVGTDPSAIAKAALRILDASTSEAGVRFREELVEANPYGDGYATPRIVAALENIAFGDAAPTPFGPGFSRNAVLEVAGYRTGKLNYPSRDEPLVATAESTKTQADRPHTSATEPHGFEGVERRSPTRHVRYIGPERRDRSRRVLTSHAKESANTDADDG
ncbi:MAG: UDP-N-acetylglucosamine 2-epimerase (non-hydrolyzing) [Candidatus Nanopelagicales bacterium]|nr:UDP-N-acetylglucosamine 2-epimerase (non-hydrolyzing) [Candidatus Nanopelagicales bacterium]